MTDTTPLLSLRGVSHEYAGATGPVAVLRYISLDVRAGELVTIMGPSGSGKSTLLGIAGGLELPTTGEARINGRPTAALAPAELSALRRRDIGFIFQRYNLVPLLTVLENVALPLELDGAPLAARTAAALDALALVDLADAASAYPENLSGGQQQRVAIARSVVGRPRLVLADEPTGALDSVASEGIIRLLRERTDGGAAAIVVTHDARLAAWADRVLYLTDGALHADPVAAR